MATSPFKTAEPFAGPTTPEKLFQTAESVDGVTAPKSNQEFEISTKSPIKQYQQGLFQTVEPYDDVSQPEKINSPVDIWDEIRQGLQRSVAPQTLSKAELVKTSIPELGAQVAGEVGAGLSAGAIGGAIGGAVGALPGAAVGALAGSTLWGLYKGIVGEEALSKAQDRPFSPLNAALSVGVEVNPLTKGTRIARAARQAVLQGSEAFAQTDDMKSALLAGALGGGLVGLTPAKKAWIENVNAPRAFPTNGNPEGRITGTELSDAIRFMEDNSPQLQTRVNQAMTKLDTEMPASVLTMVNSGKATWPTDSAFARWFLMKPGSSTNIDTPLGAAEMERFSKLAQTMSPERLQSSYTRFMEGVVQRNVVNDIVEDKAKELTRLKDPLENAWFAKKLKDPLFVARDTDRVLGSNLEGSLSMFPEARNNFSVAAGPFIDRAQKLVDRMRKENVNPEQIGRMLNGSVPVPKNQEEWVTSWRSLWDDVQTHQAQHGVKIGYLENYFPQLSKAPAEFVSTLKQKAQELITKYKGADLNDVPEAEDFLKALKYIKSPEDTARAEVSMREIPGLIDKLETPSVYKQFIGFDGSAAFNRSGQMPEFIRDFDVGRAFQNYVNKNLKPIYFRDAFEQMANNVAMLRGAGMEDTAGYFTHYLKQMSGQPSNFSAWVDASINKFKTNAIMEQAEAKSALERMSTKTKQFLPDLINWNSSLIYPNLLGYNLSGPIRNMTQTWLTTAPEIGGAYGYDLTRRGWQKALVSMHKLKRPTAGENLDMPGEKQIKGLLRLDAMEKFLQAKGMTPGKFFGEGASIVQNSLRNVPGLGKGVQVINDLGQLGMTLYSGSDIANRYITYQVAHELAKDISANSPKVQKFLDTLSPGVKSELRSAKNQEQLGDVMARYLIAKTQFNYGRESLNEFGRDFGKVASMFTKWPVMIWSDIGEVRRTQGYGRIMGKYMAPLAALGVGDYALNESNMTNDPTVRVLLGRGLKSVSPVNSVLGIDTPPLLRLPIQSAEIGKSLLDADFKKARKQLIKTLAPFVPGGFIPANMNRYKDL